MITISILAIILFMLIGSIFAKRKYVKFSKKEKGKIKDKHSNPIPILLGALVYIGYMTMFLSIILNIYFLRYIAFVLMGIGLVFNGAEEWKINLNRGLFLVILGGVVLLITGLLSIRFI
ncbi:hypothetical protein [Rossellomorea aquimaris]|uniref:hypothetical protein n=1 Tax=Rossellomorea aquimaris TaxID=189382 RepID=UPI0007D0A5D9|nr:hypothetical protein [Rossellomorea aquimaris]